eukprot:CAMPEP_0176403932 /NCGR_PEP_ID=MMETSP0126-20121128/50471_1 /TAXON_ID=141414 ORGANISM="Strombidinopsis acuminatum, Strain SPMC142" /NCGR_SAMPLE_ID=MMETSP0126 /ASSEMBLY_ACC=CAM_ASM_000229 /LENGTH=86 /DNA_ID=CAMNT_0017782441 /DNA_START=160 /DNA_END=417 /DNA_ORIENTATION=+
MLGKIREWNPSCTAISFKLETDPEILKQKATNSLNTYKMHAVIANLLSTCRKECIVYDKNSGEDGKKLEVTKEGQDLEELIVRYIK